MITADQMKAGRALVGLTQADIAKETSLSVQTIKRMEALGTAKSSAGNVQAVEEALRSAGVTFLAPGDLTDGGYGVRLTKKPLSLLKVRRLSPEQQIEQEEAQQRRLDEQHEAYTQAVERKYGKDWDVDPHHYEPERPTEDDEER